MDMRSKRKAVLQRALPTMPAPPNIVAAPKPTTLRIACSREKLHAALRRRYFLSSAPVVIIAFLLLVIAASILLSRTVWAEYDPWNIPSVVSGLASTVLALPVLVWIKGLLTDARSKKRLRNLKGIVRITIRRGYATPIILGLTLCLLPAILIIPARDLLKEVHETIGIGGPGRFSAAKELFKGKVEKAPRYMGDQGASCMGAVLDAIKLDKQNTPSAEWNEIERRAKPSLGDKRAYIRQWSAYVIALNHANNERLTTAKADLERLANDENGDWIIRYRSFERLGYISQTNRDLDMAKNYYQDAIQFGGTSAIYENLGAILDHQKSFDVAEEIYKKSEEVFEAERVGGSHSRAGVHYQNLASFYDNYAEALLEKSKGLEINDIQRDSLIASYRSRIDQAEKMIENAYAADPNDLAIYWIAASIEFNAKRENKAVDWLDKAQEFLERKDDRAVEALKQNDYATIGPFYTAWLRVRILFNLTPDSPAMPQAINELKSKVTGFSNSPVDRVREKLIDVQATGFSDSEDLPDLGRMKAAGLFAAYVIPILPSDGSNLPSTPVR